MLRKASAILLIFILSWGNTGFCLNVHYCDTSKDFSVKINHIFGEECQEDQMLAEHKKCDSPEGEEALCCKKINSLRLAQDDDCCSDTEVEVRIEDAYHITHFPLQFKKNANDVPYIPLAGCFCHNVVIPSRFLSEENVFSEPLDPEIAWTGKEKLTSICVYRI